MKDKKTANMLSSPERPKGGIATIQLFLKKYFIETSVVTFVLLLSGLAELLGIGTVLPLVSVIIDNKESGNNTLADMMRELFTTLQINPSLANLLCIITVAITLKAVVVFGALNYASKVSTRISLEYRNKLIKALMKAKWSYFTKLPLGHISNALSEEAMRAGNCYMLACKAMGSLVMIIIYLCASFMLAWKISTIALCLGLALGFFLRFITKIARDSSYRMTAAMKDLLAQMTDMLIGVKALKSMAKEHAYLEQIYKTTDIVSKSQERQMSSMHLLNVIYEPILVLFLSIGMFITIEYIKMPVTSVILLAFLFYRLMGQAHQFQNFYQNMIIAESAVWSLERQIDNASTQSEPDMNHYPVPSLHKAIEFKNVGFSYSPDTHLLHEFNAVIPANSMTVLFGPSGSGKSTIMDMILGFQMPDQGSIEIDGKDLNFSNIHSWRSKIGYVPQETFLFHDSIENNISLGDGAPDSRRIHESLTKSGAMNFVLQRPEGVKAVVGERGGMLSGGQRQRIALARALYNEPDLLVLDEATSGLDPDTEKAIFETLNSLKSQMTILVISHNPAILSYADHTIKLTGPHVDRSAHVST